MKTILSSEYGKICNKNSKFFKDTEEEVIVLEENPVASSKLMKKIKRLCKKNKKGR